MVVNAQGEKEMGSGFTSSQNVKDVDGVDPGKLRLKVKKRYRILLYYA